MVLLAVALIGALGAAIMGSNSAETSNIDKETLGIRASEVQRYAGELERAVRYIMQNGKSESDIRFAHPDANSDYGDLSADSDKSDQVFHIDGGGAGYRLPPADILASPNQKWEFYGGTAIHHAGSTNPELVAVLPNVTKQFCEKINTLNSQSIDQPVDDGGSAASASNAGGCIHGGSDARFGNNTEFYDAAQSRTANTMDDSTFTVHPALQACVYCEADEAYHFYHVLLVR